eukprot:8720812-Ditylum_brightwellii.AAC.2
MHAKGDGSNFDISIEEADDAAAVTHTLLSRGVSETMKEDVGMLVVLVSDAAYSLATSSLTIFHQNDVNRTGDDVAVAAGYIEFLPSLLLLLGLISALCSNPAAAE